MKNASFVVASLLLCSCGDNVPIQVDAPPSDAVIPDSSPPDALVSDAVIPDAAPIDAFVEAPWNQRLFIPPQLLGPQFQLNVAPSTREFFPGVITSTYGINGDFLGPTLVMRRGDDVRLDVTNNLAEMTTMHWHGFHVAAADDGGPHSMIDVGSTWSPQFTVLNEAGTYWYHPHPHGQTTPQVSKGLAGLIIVQDDHEDGLSLPRTYGVDDIPLIIQDKDITAEGVITSAELGDTMMVNGQIEAVCDLPAQLVRLRLLNASNMRTYAFGMSDGRSFSMIAGDAGLLDSPVPMTRVRLTPGERAEIVVDLSQDLGAELALMSYSAELTGGIIGGPGSPPGPGSTLNGTNFEVMRISVGAARLSAVTALPATLITRTRWSESDAARTRTVDMTRINGNFTFDNMLFDMEVINHTVQLDDIEIWEIRNMTAIAHPFHIHDISFFILDRNGVPPPAHEQGPKDVFMLRPNERLRFITRFEDFADPTTPYMYHCHMLPHEDDGMMGQFVVLP